MWNIIFRSLKDMNRYVMIETEDVIYVGAIMGIRKQSVTVNHFDADGVWQDEPARIRFKDIQSVTFGSRYVDVFSRYIPKL